MGKKIVTSPERLRPLLGWLNGGDAAGMEKALGRFLGEAVEAWGGAILSYTGKPSRRDIDALRLDLLRVLAVAESGHEGSPWWDLASLSFAPTRQRDRPERLPETAAERLEVLGPGAFTMSVNGTFRDVVLYTFMRTLSEPGGVLLSRCPAPAPGDWSRACGRYFIAGGHVGRPAIYCSTTCRVRAAREKASDYSKKDRR